MNDAHLTGRAVPGNPAGLPPVSPVARMPALMRTLPTTLPPRSGSSAPIFALLLLLLLFGVGCGNEIGDACITSVDCSPNGDRQCDSSSKGGYCTVQGCDFNTCPEEATCVQFFTGSFSNRECNLAIKDRRTDVCLEGEGCTPCPSMTECNPLTEDRGCTFDELCSLTDAPCENVENGEDDRFCGRCVPRSSEVRFCMKTCDSDGDCRDGYECRDLEKMKEHGGQPVLAPGVDIDESSPKFCANAPS